ncbi:Os11g0202500 [Oryza sativa Japonica Group]|uniref:Os11g0202500 protein n=1 Tax=Oryza sativa subsp. japonica TaxID=39947 RepID=A0A0P0Y0E4_ORYSJ|nr:hypothetical protein EE612_054058 [Oryza sativa]BAT13103.1 Os11g0202500 [Oryza sativa Japonica Group]
MVELYRRAFDGLAAPFSEFLGYREDGEDATVRWLDAQPAKSVVYVALGSEVPLRVDKVHELALGLEVAGTRFLWDLRKPTGVSDTDLLPAGFEERTRGRGVMATRWVPQMSILAHAEKSSRQRFVQSRWRKKAAKRFKPIPRRCRRSSRTWPAVRGTSTDSFSN